MSDRVTASSLYARIAATHAAPEWACFPEVANGTGSNARRHADAVAMSLWPSRGLIVRGFEIKISRSDYRREAADPTKAEAVARWCDEWWIVAPDGLIRDPETELPPAWGLMVPANGLGLRTIRKAERTEAAPLTRSFVAAVLRAADKQVTTALSGWVRREDIAVELERARQEGIEANPHVMRRLQEECDKAHKQIADFEAASGLKLLEGVENLMKGVRKSLTEVVAETRADRLRRLGYDEVDEEQRAAWLEENLAGLEAGR